MSAVSQRERNRVVRGMLHDLEARHPGEEAHAQRVAVYAVAMGEALGLGDAELLTTREKL